jgi:hypothetical protein
MTDENLHFRSRRSRLAKFFHDLNPALVGVQEPFCTQINDLMKLWPAKYRVIGMSRPSLDRSGVIDHPVRLHDFQTAIIYDSNVLELVESRHTWLSEHPDVENSISWGGKGAK